MENDDKDYSQPVAYDANGQPLYAHPPVSGDEQPTVAEVPVPEPVVITVPAGSSAAERHASSIKQHPDLNLTEGEYIIMTVRRHPIALLAPFALGVVLIALAFSFLFNYDVIVGSLDLTDQWANPATVLLPVLLFSFLVAIGMYVAYFVYTNNRFHLTNESVIQKIQYSLLAKQEQTISLGDVEDVNFTQKGILQLFLNYGTIRLSTTGDEHTYKFIFVAHPKEEAAALTNAVEAFKNGRKVDIN